jgi:hypothetical protein
MMNYKWFEKRVTEVPHYRGTPNRHPLGARSQTRYYFLKDVEEGQTVFDVCYDYRWNSRKLTPEEAVDAKAKGIHVHEYNNEQWVYDKRYNPVVRVRPDDSVEFVKAEYHQGDRMFLDKTNYGVFFNDSRRGGVVYANSHRKAERSRMLPIFQGLRVTPDMKPITEFDVTLLSVDRKKSKGLIKEYEHFFKVSETMLMGMTDKNVFAQMVKEIVKDHSDKIEFKPNNKFIKDHAVSIMNTSPLDAFVIFAWYHDVSYVRYMASEGRPPSWRDGLQFEQMFNAAKRYISKDLYRANPDIFVERVFTAGEVYPQTDWGVTIRVGEEIVNQCGYSAN